MPSASSLAKAMNLSPLAGMKDHYFGVKPSLHAGTDLAVIAVITPARRQPGHFHFRVTVAGRFEQSGFGDAAKVEDAVFWAMILYEDNDLRRTE